MRVLVIGSGGREHALCQAIAASPLLTKLWCAPGNPGTAQTAENVAIDALDIPALVAFASAQKIDLVVPGPEAPLAAGLSDAMAQAGVACCGPSGAAARLEGSKSFAHEICDAAGIPAARYEAFDDADAAREFVLRRGAPLVVKADGLAAGKGVVVAATEAEALEAVDAMMTSRLLGDAGARVVIEECLIGREASLFALCDGANAIPLGAAADHKRAGEGDTGPNTGGMGSYSPVPHLPPELQAQAMDEIVRPALAEMSRRGAAFRGILFAGLMLTEAGPRLIEFNVRFGDPECQALLPLLRSDLLAALVAACEGELASFALRWSDQASVAVVLAARGYPGRPETGTELRGLDAAAAVPGVRLFHGATAARDGRMTAAGGRVLTVCATGPTLRQARDTAYEAVAEIDWPEGFFRRDIGASLL